MADLKQDLSAVIKGELKFADEISKTMLTDFVGARVGKADAYVKAADVDDVKNALRVAYAHKAPVVIRGAGTNLVGSTVPDGGLVLDLTAMNRILELDEENMTVTVEPGVILADLIKFVESRGYLYAPDPAEKLASIGGNVATNAGGMRAVKYGVTRDYVLSLELVRIDGTAVKLGAKTYKYATGLNLQQLAVGSEGTLGVITKIVLKLLPLPEYTANIILAFHSLKEGIKTVNEIFAAHMDPTAIEFVEKKVIALGEKYTGKSFPIPNADAYLIVTFDGDKDSTVERIKQLKSTVLKDGAAFDCLSLEDPQVASDVWEIRGALAKAVKASGVWEPVDTVVPLNRIADFVDYVNAVSIQEQVRIVAFGHAGDGNVHLCVLKDQIADELWPEKLRVTLSKIYKGAYSLGGLLSAEHGVGKSKREFFLENVDPRQLELMRGVKRAFDEFNLLNPHSGYSI